MSDKITLRVGEEKFTLYYKHFDNVSRGKEFKTLWEAEDFISNNSLMEMTLWHSWDNGSGLYNTRMIK